VYIESKGPYLSKGWAPLEGFIDGKLKYIDLPIKELYDIERDFAETKNIISSRKISDLSRKLKELKKKMSGTDTASARMTLPAETLRRLRSFGYLAGLKVEEKSVFTRDDDLKTLLPIQNKLRSANQLFNQKKYREARELYEQVLGSKPDDIGTYAHLADTLHYLRKPQAAVDILRRGLQNKPDSLELKAKLGVFLTEINHNDEAVALLKEVLAADEGDGANWNYLGVAFFRKRDFSRADEAYARALALDPGNAMAYANLGTLYLARFAAEKDGAFREKAVGFFNKAIELDGKSVAAYNGRGAAYQFAGQVEAALADWKRALDLQPDFTDTYFNIAVTLIAVGRKSEANDFLQRLQAGYFTLLSAADRAALERLLAATAGQ
jgi:Flp pilus assembly protein TadD